MLINIVKFFLLLIFFTCTKVVGTPHLNPVVGHVCIPTCHCLLSSAQDILSFPCVNPPSLFLPGRIYVWGLDD